MSQVRLVCSDSIIILFFSTKDSHALSCIEGSTAFKKTGEQRQSREINLTCFLQVLSSTSAHVLAEKFQEFLHPLGRYSALNLNWLTQYKRLEETVMYFGWPQ